VRGFKESNDCKLVARDVDSEGRISRCQYPRSTHRNLHIESIYEATRSMVKDPSYGLTLDLINNIGSVMNDRI
jgi:hypothetical protein